MAITEVRSETDVKTVQANFAALDARNDGITASEAEINKLDGATVIYQELNTLDGVAATLTTTATPASGSCGVQFYFTDAAGMATTGVRSGIGYISDNAGAPATAITSVATLTNGTIVTLVTGRVFLWTTSADLELGITLTGTAGTKYVTFVLPNGKIAVSTACVIN